MHYVTLCAQLYCTQIERLAQHSIALNQSSLSLTTDSLSREALGNRENWRNLSESKVGLMYIYTIPFITDITFITVLIVSV